MVMFLKILVAGHLVHRLHAGRLGLFPESVKKKVKKSFKEINSNDNKKNKKIKK